MADGFGVWQDGQAGVCISKQPSVNEVVNLLEVTHQKRGSLF